MAGTGDFNPGGPQVWGGILCPSCGMASVGGHVCSVPFYNQPTGRTWTTNATGPITTHGTPAKKPYKCPVCEGRGRVDQTFYGDSMNASKYVICQTCHGNGIVWGES